MKFSCKTFFDITSTGVTGHYKSSRVPFRDKAEQEIDNEKSWNYSRNQQRNWETLTQLISMRSQIFELTIPKKIDNLWRFQFEVETPGIFGPPENPVKTLLEDCNGVPMLIGLKNKENLSSILITSGVEQNIWFEELK